MITNFQSLTEQIVEIGKVHSYIQKVESGDLYQKENLLADEYPYFFVHIEDSTLKEYSIQFNYSLIVADQVSQTQGNNESNINQVLSDTLTTIVQIINELKSNDYDIEINPDVQINPFTSGWMSNAVGWTAKIGIVISSAGVNCETPISNPRKR